MLTKPGKVSDDYINGKRFRYANPFQFYLSISIVFFLILGANLKYEEFKELTSDVSVKKEKPLNIINFNVDENKKLDSITKNSKAKMDQNLKKLGVDSITRNTIQKNIDTTKVNKKKKDSDNNSLSKNFSRMIDFQKKNPSLGINESLDSLNIKKSFKNRFLYRKVNVIDSFNQDADKANRTLLNELISYASISIFIFLPIFTLFLKLLYVRRNYTYVEHLIFVFHTQTVFFFTFNCFLFIKNLGS